MAQSHDWFAPRSLARFGLTGQRTPASRPCLPAVEKLGDRVLLSAAPDAEISQIPPGPCLVAEVNGLVGQPQSTNSVMIDEFTIQKTLDKSSPKLLSAVNDEFYKLNDLFGGLDAALITGQATPDVQIKYSEAIGVELVKIEVLTGGGGTTSPTADAVVEQPPAVQNLVNDADGLLSTLQGLGTGAGGASLKVDLQYLTLDAAFTDLSNTIIKLNSDVLQQKILPAALDYLEYKLDEVFITSFEPPDPAIKLDLQGAMTEADTLVSSILSPTSPTPVGTSPTGTTVSDS